MNKQPFEYAASRERTEQQGDVVVSVETTGARAGSASEPVPVATEPLTADSAEGKEAGKGWLYGAGFLSIVTVLVSAANYGFSLVAVRLLEPREFSEFSAAQGLLLVLGTGAMAAIPWAMAHHIATEDRPEAGSEALRFGLIAAVVQALLVAPIAGLVLGAVGGFDLGLLTGIATAFISLLAAPIGYLQGSGAVDRVARLRLVETGVRVAAGLVAVVLVSQSAVGALVGLPIGTVVMLLLGLRRCRDGFPLQRGSAGTARRLLTQSIRLGSIQVLLTMLATLDVVVVEAASYTAEQAGSYQAAVIFGRIPLFVSNAIALAAFAPIAAGGEEGVGRQLRNGFTLFAVLTVPVVVACWTVPGDLLRLVVPADYTETAEMLRYTAVAGAAIGIVNVVTTAHQARRRYRACLLILIPAAVAQPVALLVVGHTAGLTAFGTTTVVIAVASAVLLLIDARRWWRGSLGRPGVLWVAAVVPAAGAVVLRQPVLWLACVLALALVLAAAAHRSSHEVRISGRHDSR